MKTIYEQVVDLGAGITKLQTSAKELDSAIDRLSNRLKWMAIILWVAAGIAFGSATYIYIHLP